MKDEQTKPAQEKEHHVFCNYFMLPREGCKMCEGLFADYPYPEVQDGENVGDILVSRYFPTVIVVKR